MSSSKKLVLTLSILSLVATVVALLLATVALLNTYDSGSAHGGQDTNMATHGWFSHTYLSGVNTVGTGVVLGILLAIPLALSIISYLFSGSDKRVSIVSLSLIGFSILGSALVRAGYLFAFA